jgi:hypothetical protein
MTSSAIPGRTPVGRSTSTTIIEAPITTATGVPMGVSGTGFQPSPERSSAAGLAADLRALMNGRTPADVARAARDAIEADDVSRLLRGDPVPEHVLESFLRVCHASGDHRDWLERYRQIHSLDRHSPDSRQESRSEARSASGASPDEPAARDDFGDTPALSASDEIRPRTPSGEDRPEDPRTGTSRVGFLHRLEQQPGLTALVAIATFAALIVAVLAAVPDWREMLLGDDPSPAGKPISAPSRTQDQSVSAGSAVDPIDLVVRDPIYNDQGVTPPTVEITVHNKGAQRSVITRAVVTVEDSTLIPPCSTEGGAVPLSATYDLTLPLDPAVGTALRVPVSQQQAPDEADRFALRVGIPNLGESKRLYGYRLRFELEADGSSGKLLVGTAVMVLPWSPDNSDAGYYWSDDYESGKTSLDWLGEDAASISQCMKNNSALLKRLISAGTELSPELSHVNADIRL